MKPQFSILLLVIAGAAVACAAPEPFRVATFNVHTSADTDHPWSYRKETIIEAIREVDADMIGLQEVEDDQRFDLVTAFVDTYTIAWMGTNVTMTKHQALTVTSSNGLILTNLRHDHITFGVAHAHEGRPELEGYRDALPRRGVILVGDFNALVDANPWGVEPLMPIFTSAGFRDVYGELHPHNRVSSGCDWSGCWSGDVQPDTDPRVDWILTSDDFEPLSATIVAGFTPDGQYMSDHNLVVATVGL